jgi:two-component system, chemotaxis family, chemotaxis protein CheY
MKKTILVVEDFAGIRNFVCQTLQQKGYETIGAANGMEAYQLLTQQQSVNLVLTDYNMPECTGFDLLKRIKSNHALTNTPVVFLTTESSPEKMQAAKEAGLSAWIKKPYRAEVFFAQIENALSNG